MAPSSNISLTWIRQSDSSYPATLTQHLGGEAPKRLAAIGNLKLLNEKALGLFCSVKCPGDLILRTYDLSQALREARVPVIGGFHSPMERECLTILLRGVQPVILCPARSLTNLRMPAAYRRPLEEGRLLLLTPFETDVGRPTTQTALMRNRLVAALADRIFVAYASPSGKTEEFCRTVLGWGKPVFTFAHEANARLIALGAQAADPGVIP